MTNRHADKRVSIISISGRMRTPSVKPEGWYGCRHTQVILMSLGFLCCYAVRVTTSVTLEAMTDAASANPDFEEFDWDNSVKDVILSSFFWGYVCTQIPGSMAAHHWGAQKLFSVALSCTGFFTLIIPLAARYGGWEAVCAVRVFSGLAQGTVLPILHTLLSKWVPIQERGSLSTFVYSGGWIGNVVCLFSSGLFSASQLGWPSCFYFWGGVTMLCGLVYFFIGKESPAEHPNIPADEKAYIEVSLGITETKETLPTPWRAILTSVPVWALLVTQLAQNWGFWMLLTKSPSYTASVLNYDIKNNGLFSSLPYLTAWILSFPASYISDVLIKKNILSTDVSRKLCNSLGEWLPAFALIALGYVPQEQPGIAIGILVFAVSSNILIYCGHGVNHIDLSPNFAGTLMGITNTAANISGILAPLVATVIVTDPSDAGQWRNIFFLSAGIYLVGNLIFILFGTAKIQVWNDPIGKLPEIEIEEASVKSMKDSEKADIDRGS